MTDPGAPSSPPPPRPSYYGQRRLLRFPDDGPLGGVCAGVADYLSIDPTIVRIAAVVLAFTGPGIPAYLLAWLIVPAADGTVIAPLPHHGERRHDRVNGLLFVLLMFLVLFFFVDHWWWAPARGWFWPVALIVVGAWLLLRRHDEDDVPPPPTPPGPPAGPGGPASPWQAAPPTPPTSVVPVPPLPPIGTTEPTSPSAAPEAGGTDAPEDHAVPDTEPTTVIDDAPNPDDAPTEAFGATTSVLTPPPPRGDDPTTLGYGPPPYGGPDHRRPRRRRVLGPVVVGVLLLWGGIAWLAGVSAATGFAVGLCLVGAGFVVGAFTGGSRGLILPAFVIAVALIVTSAVHIPISGGIGPRHDTITARRDLHRTYELAIGERTLDLRDLPLTARTTDVTLKQGIGHVEVIVPDDATVRVDSKASIGSIEVFGHEEGGTSLEAHREVQGSRAAGRLHVHIELGIGRVDVRRADRTLDHIDEPAADATPSSSTVTTLPTDSTATTAAAAA
jgi:phage shock protein PspC (stress-responsive transcriptional regulator)